MGALEDRELAVQAARAATTYLLEILWISETTILDPDAPEPVRNAYAHWRARIDELVDILAHGEPSEKQHMTLTLRALILALGFI